MLKRNSKAIAIVMAFAICLTVVAPFLAAAPAAAASTYSIIKSQTVSSISTSGTLATYLTSPRIQIDVNNAAGLSAGDILTIHLPSDIKMDNGNDATAPRVVFTTNSGFSAGADAFMNGAAPAAAPVAYGAYNAAAGTGSPIGQANVRVSAPAMSSNPADLNALDVINGAAPRWVAYAVGDSTLEIKILSAPATGYTGNARLYVDLIGCKVAATFDGDISAKFIAPSNSGFTSGVLAFAKYVSGGQGTVSAAKSVTTMSSSATTMDTIMIQETVKNSIQNGEVLTLKLPPGFKWAAAGAATPAWAYAASPAWATATPVAGDTRKMTITAPAVGAFALGALTSEGRIYLSGTSIVVDDESQAKKGDVTVNITSDKGNVTTQDIVVANYVDFGVTVAEKTTKDVVAGWRDTELGSFTIKEGIAGSLIPGRTVIFTLPSGVKWDDTTYPGVGPAANTNGLFAITVNGGVDVLKNAAGFVSIDTTKRVLKITLPTAAFAKSDMEVKNLKVKISPEFSGDIKVAVSGTAGAAGEPKVATVKPIISMTAPTAANIVIGTQGQAIGDVMIKESVADKVKAGANLIQFDLPNGAYFAELPTATVTEGDMTIDKVTYAAGTSKQSVCVTFKSTSSKASTIKLSNLKVTTDRTVPEGPFKLSISANASTSLSDTAMVVAPAATADFNVDRVAEVLIGTCITPAPGQGTAGAAAGQFRIDSNIYEVNGVAKVMDAAPYVKAGRTYVPVKFLGLALGVAEKDIVWDAAAQKATLTLGDKKVELTIGSTSFTVNGEAKTMDVAPEITNGRTMLPAKYVAEGLGFQVGWDAATRTVVVSK